MKKSSIIIGLIVICLACSVLVSCSQDIKNIIVGTWENTESHLDKITFFSDGTTDYDDGSHHNNCWRKTSSTEVGIYPAGGGAYLQIYTYDKKEQTLTTQMGWDTVYVKID